MADADDDADAEGADDEPRQREHRVVQEHSDAHDDDPERGERVEAGEGRCDKRGERQTEHNDTEEAPNRS